MSGHSPSTDTPYATPLIGRRQELTALGGLIADAEKGRSGVLLLRGEPGIGKSALLDDAAGVAQKFLVIRAAGVESEMELPYAGLQQLCRPFADRLADLPTAERDALRTAIGLSTGKRPDRFVVGLAVLDLMAALAEDQPVLCLIDDAKVGASSRRQLRDLDLKTSVE